MVDLRAGFGIRRPGFPAHHPPLYVTFISGRRVPWFGGGNVPNGRAERPVPPKCTADTLIVTSQGLEKTIREE
ncbi:hypothetical protein Q0Z83_058860 [Actinoplanes sichuanensis]|nr:hypothetical protein Q0Z83_058860 [Actinoplanes sichuanensis]